MINVLGDCFLNMDKSPRIDGMPKMNFDFRYWRVDFLFKLNSKLLNLLAFLSIQQIRILAPSHISISPLLQISILPLTLEHLLPL